MGNHASSPSARPSSPARLAASNATIAHTPMDQHWTAGEGSDAPTRQAMSSSFQRFPIRARQLGVDAATGERRERVVARDRSARVRGVLQDCEVRAVSA